MRSKAGRRDIESPKRLNQKPTQTDIVCAIELARLEIVGTLGEIVIYT